MLISSPEASYFDPYLAPNSRSFGLPSQNLEQRASAEKEKFDFEEGSGGRKSLICPSQEKFHNVVLQGVRNISDAH